MKNQQGTTEFIEANNGLDILKTMKFTAHNIRLHKNITTFSLRQKKKDTSIVQEVTGIDYSTVPVITEMPSYIGINKLLQLVGFDKRKTNLSMIDLGCLEGGYAIEFARSGYKNVVGIEGRKSNFDKCQILSNYLGLENLNFRHDDVKNFESYKEVYDVVLCLGLLYHLDSPIEFLQKVNRCMSDNGVMILETHYAPKNKYEHDNFFLPKVYPNKNKSEIAYLGHSYEGCWWHEYSPDTPENKRHPWSAVSNHKSFVPTLQSLMEALYNTGFKQVYAIQNPIINKIEENWCRVMWACFK